MDCIAYELVQLHRHLMQFHNALNALLSELQLDLKLASSILVEPGEVAKYKLVHLLLIIFDKGLK